MATEYIGGALTEDNFAGILNHHKEDDTLSEGDLRVIREIAEEQRIAQEEHDYKISKRILIGIGLFVLVLVGLVAYSAFF